jgi:hypothetical protein
LRGDGGLEVGDGLGVGVELAGLLAGLVVIIGGEGLLTQLGMPGDRW